MKAAASIVLLILLLYNMLGLSVAVLCFENDFQTPAPTAVPGKTRILKEYSPSLQRLDNEKQEGLYRLDDQLYNIVDQDHLNDTLYVTLQVNSSAWQRFTELSEMMQEVNSDQKASHPISRAIKLLNDLLKVYLPVTCLTPAIQSCSTEEFTKVLFEEIQCNWPSKPSQLHSPPPEVA